MDPPWLFCPQITVGNVQLDEAETRHALRSLRLRPGDAITLFDGQGQVAHGRLVESTVAEGESAGVARGARKRDTGVLVAVVRIDSVPPPKRRLTLIVAACKGPRLDFLVEKCTELGATRLVFAEFARSVVRVGETHVEKLRRTAVEACKQCGRAWLPEIEAGVSLEKAVANRGDAALLVAHPAAEAVPLGAWLHEHSRDAKHIAVAIGPEGGLTAHEREDLRAQAGKLVRLGEFVMRIETAAIAAASIWSSRAPER